jgi:cation transport ATPase-like protein/PAP2 superfamily protein
VTTPTGALASSLAPSADGPVWHALSAGQVPHAEQVDGRCGLSPAEVTARAQRFGPNTFDTAQVESRWRAFIRQCADPMQIVLLVAGVVSLYPLKEPAAEPVPGDIVSIEAGDVVPADGRLLQVVTWVGSTAVIIPLGLIAGGWFARRRHEWRPVVLLAVAVAGAVALYDIIKFLVGRPRPPPAIWIGHFRGAAFPSGHAAQTVAFYSMLAIILGAGGPPPGEAGVVERGLAHRARGRRLTHLPGRALADRRPGRICAGSPLDRPRGDRHACPLQRDSAF